MLPPVVTVTRDVGRSPLDLPYAISSLRPDSLAPGQTHTLVEQTLALLPGVTVANRTNPSQDTRISIRGFGARSQFGARSIRILRDGMPLTLPDGQTPIDYLDLESVGRVEVIRGYGVGALRQRVRRRDRPSLRRCAETFPSPCRDGRGPAATACSAMSGCSAAPAGATTYEGNIGHTTSDGYRAFAQQRLTNAFVRAHRGDRPDAVLADRPWAGHAGGATIPAR